MEEATNDTDGTQKKSSLEDLNKEELMKKYKHLLIIAQRAKRAKDEAGEEIKRLKEQLNTSQMKKSQVEDGGKKCDEEKKEKELLQNQVSAMQEMLATLTDQKLQFTMEMDKLKKENVLLEKQLHQLKIEETKIQATAVRLQSQVEELETAAESYKRQTHRLTNENESLLQQMETLENEMQRKEQSSGLNLDQVKLLEGEIQTLRDEMECLTEENSRKKDQMKELYENFSKEKIELDNKLETDRNKHCLENQNLFEELQVIAKEKERILIDIKSIEENNIELDKLVKSIRTKNDALTLNSGKLNEDKEKVEKHLQLLKTENKIIMDEGENLRSENQHLKELLDNASEEIVMMRSENNLLKIDKQEFNEKLHLVVNEREKLSSELKQVEYQLHKLLCQALSNLQLCEGVNSVTKADVEEIENDSEQNSSLLNIISSLNNKLTQFYSIASSNIRVLREASNECSTQEEQKQQTKQLTITNDTESIFLHDVSNNNTENTSDVILQGKDNLLRLYSELQLLNVVISNLETHCEFLQTENNELKGSITKLRAEAIFTPQESGLDVMLKNSEVVLKKNCSTEQDENMKREDIGETCNRDYVCECSDQIKQLKKELEMNQNSLETKTVEINQLKEKLDDLEQSVQFGETDTELRNELSHSRELLSKKQRELSLVQEELAFLLTKQREYGIMQKGLQEVNREITESNNCIEGKTDELKNELSKLYEEKCNSQVEIERLRDELAKINELYGNSSTSLKSMTEETKNMEFNKLQNELLASKECTVYLESCIDELQKEKAFMEQEVIDKQELLSKSSVKEENSGNIDVLKQKPIVQANEEVGVNDMIKLNEELHEVQQQLSEKCSLLQKFDIEVEMLKENVIKHEKEKINLVSENSAINSMLVDLKNIVEQNNSSLKEKNLEIEAVKEEFAKLDGERLKLLGEIDLKSKLLEEKEMVIISICRALQDIDASLKTARDELQEKVLKLENDSKNYKLLFDEKCIEINAMKEELQNIKTKSDQLCKESSSETISELHTALEVKDKDIENLKTSLLQAESRLAETLVKVSELEGGLLNVHNLSESLKTELSTLNKLHGEKTSEFSSLQEAFQKQCSELDSANKFSKKFSSELEIEKNKFEQSEVNYMKIENELKEQLIATTNDYDLCVNDLKCARKEIEQFQSNKTVIQNELFALQKQYSKKVEELDSVTEEHLSLGILYSSLKEKLNISIIERDNALKELDYEKNELQFSRNKQETVEEELRIARNRYEEKATEVESLSSELVNIENASAETLDRLMAVTTELDSVKDAQLASSRQLDEMAEQLKDVTSNLERREVELQESIQCRNILNSRTQLMVDGLVSLSSRVSHLNTLRTSLSEEVKTLQTNVLNTLQQDTWTGIQKTLTNYVESEIAVMKKEHAEFLGEMNEMNQVLKQRGETISKLKEMNSELEQKLRETNNKLEITQEDLKKQLIQLETKDCTICNLEIDLAKSTKAHQENIHMKDETIHTLEKELSKFMECQHELETKTSALEAKEEAIHNLEAELNKQSERLRELKSKDKMILALEEEIKNLKLVRQNESEDVQEDADIQDGRIKELKDEVSTLKTRIQTLEHEAEEMRKESGDVHSEAMSSSTISRTEESSRLKDLEETFEERYTKLRTVAVRLKKRVSELTVQQTQLENDKKKLVADKADLQNKVTQLSAHAKNLQTMQQEYDRLQDDIEKQKSEVKELTKALELAVNESTTLKIQIHKCLEEKEYKVKELETCVKEKQKLEFASKELSSHIHTLKKEKETDNMTRKENEKELKRLEDELKAEEKRLAEEVDRHKSTQELLETSRQECKKRSVLSLEMEDYERSVADLTQHLAAEKSKVKELDNHLDTQRDISRGLQEQISLLEQRIQSEEARSKEVKEQLNASRTRLTEVETLALERGTSMSELASQIEQHRDKNENLVLQLSELAIEKQRLVECGRSQQDGLTRQVHVLEEHVSRLKENLAERETELGDLRAEFGNYKVRAQSVLRQKARPDDGSSSFSREDNMEELAQLKQTTEIQRSKLEDASSKLQTLMLENNAIQEDRTRVLQRCQELVDTVQDLRNQNSQLQTQLQEMAIEHREAFRSQKLQAETLNQCYKQQLEELEERLQKETLSLKKQLQDTEDQLHGRHQHSPVVDDTIVDHVAHHTVTNVVYDTPNKREISTTGPRWNSNTGFVPVGSAGMMSQQDSENKLEITLLEREEGEGSESVDSTSPHLAASQDHRTELIPLDKLLSSPSEDDNNVSATINISPSVELGGTKEQLVVSECRIRHLTGLLSEAERDLAKLTQQNQVLKEEIRRQQRSVEREQHAQNFEYLKNVVLKFVTLQGGDERSRLVPVLNTILKLSPEETSQLNIVAKGGPDLQGGGRGWGSYLHLWSGTQ